MRRSRGRTLWSRTTRQRSPHSNLHHLPVGDRVAVSSERAHAWTRASATAVDVLLAPTRVGNVRVSGFVMRLNALRCGRVGCPRVCFELFVSEMVYLE